MLALLIEIKLCDDARGLESTEMNETLSDLCFWQFTETRLLTFEPCFILFYTRIADNGREKSATH